MASENFMKQKSYCLQSHSLADTLVALSQGRAESLLCRWDELRGLKY